MERLAWAITLAFAWLSLLAVSTASAQAAPRIIVGQVVDSATGLPLHNAAVTLDGTVDGGMSDSSGTFRVVSRHTERLRTLRIRRIGYRHTTLPLPERVVGDSIIVGRIVLIPDVKLWVDRIPECRELTGPAPVLRRDSILEWIQERKSSTGAVSAWLCRVKIGPETPIE